MTWRKNPEKWKIFNAFAVGATARVGRRTSHIACRSLRPDVFFRIFASFCDFFWEKKHKNRKKTSDLLKKNKNFKKKFRRKTL